MYAPIREVVKNKDNFGQADREGWTLPPPPPQQPFNQLFRDFFRVRLTLKYDYMCSETDFTQDKVIFIRLQ